MKREFLSVVTVSVIYIYALLEKRALRCLRTRCLKALQEKDKMPVIAYRRGRVNADAMLSSYVK